MKEINPIQAYQLLQNDTDTVLIDVRSTMEYEYVGHPVQAVHIPLKESPDWQTDITFADKVKQQLTIFRPDVAGVESIPLLLLCRSGKRSKLAANILEQEGFMNTYSILDGFEGDRNDQGHRNAINGWRFNKLPWEQS